MTSVCVFFFYDGRVASVGILSWYCSRLILLFLQYSNNVDVKIRIFFVFMFLKNRVATKEIMKFIYIHIYLYIFTYIFIYRFLYMYYCIMYLMASFIPTLGEEVTKVVTLKVLNAPMSPCNWTLEDHGAIPLLKFKIGLTARNQN
jgi:hypothetical protein